MVGRIQQLYLPAVDCIRVSPAVMTLAGQDPRLMAGSWLRAHGLISAGGAVR
jgi:hypothetical protein